jgi:hypothetical protein
MPARSPRAELAGALVWGAERAAVRRMAARVVAPVSHTDLRQFAAPKDHGTLNPVHGDREGEISRLFIVRERHKAILAQGRTVGSVLPHELRCCGGRNAEL